VIASKLHPLIDGLTIIELPLHGDKRGWFKENWRRNQFDTILDREFEPVQQNMSFNSQIGTTRGFHAEPWNKLISVATGSVFAAWVDLRSGTNFGKTWFTTIGPGTSVYVPKGVANAYQTLEPDTTYTYLVDGYWKASSIYTMVNLGDLSLAIDWPIPLEQAIISDKDLRHPSLEHVTPIISPPRILLLGAGGQIGQSLLEIFPNCEAHSRAELDVTHAASLESIPWSEFDVVINASAYTKVDDAEKLPMAKTCWETNVGALELITKYSRLHNLLLIHFSSDYVFDGDSESPYLESDTPNPLNRYGLSKLIGDQLVSTLKQHYIIRTSWVIGSGRNFVKTIAKCADEKKSIQVVSDQVGRLTFVNDIARGVVHLLENRPPAGIYNLTGSGPAKSWCDYAKDIYSLSGANPELVAPVSSETYAQGKELAARPKFGVLELEKFNSIGFEPDNIAASLVSYLKRLRAEVEA
jgi:dTDP-4-dehydrorhamnose reductase/dTDP-4-dehydrorhamnose 3,5-epimerase